MFVRRKKKIRLIICIFSIHKEVKKMYLESYIGIFDSDSYYIFFIEKSTWFFESFYYSTYLYYFSNLLYICLDRRNKIFL